MAKSDFDITIELDKAVNNFFKELSAKANNLDATIIVLNEILEEQQLCLIHSGNTHWLVYDTHKGIVKDELLFIDAFRSVMAEYKSRLEKSVAEGVSDE